MKYTVTQGFRRMVAGGPWNIAEDVIEIEVERDVFEFNYDHARIQHPEETEKQLRARAAYRCWTHGPVPVKPMDNETPSTQASSLPGPPSHRWHQARTALLEATSTESPDHAWPPSKWCRLL